MHCKTFICDRISNLHRSFNNDNIVSTGKPLLITIFMHVYSNLSQEHQRAFKTWQKATCEVPTLKTFDPCLIRADMVLAEYISADSKIMYNQWKGLKFRYIFSIERKKHFYTAYKNINKSKIKQTHRSRSRNLSFKIS